MPGPYPPEFRQQAVELARLSEKPIAEIATDLVGMTRRVQGIDARLDGSQG